MLTNSSLQHVAIVMDGNNRWARQRGQLGIAGHRAGVERIRDILHTCRDNQIEVLTVFAFSSENWQRPTTDQHRYLPPLLPHLSSPTPKDH